MSDVLSDWVWLYELIVVRASNLPTVHLRNQISPGWKKMNPFFALHLNGTEIFRSLADMGGDTNPAWNMPLSIPLRNVVASVPGAHIFVIIGHEKRLIGTASIPLSGFPEGISNWNHMQLNVTPAAEAFPGGTQATINVMLLKRRVPVRAAARASSTTAAGGASSSSSGDGLMQTIISGLMFGLELGKLLYGGA